MRKIVAIIYLIYGLIVFFTSMLLVLPFVIGLSFIPGKTGASSAFFFLRIWSYLISIFSFFPIKVFSNSKINKSKSYIFVSNHNSYLDAPTVVVAAPNAFKALGKIEMTKIPIFGWVYSRVVVLIDRTSKESRAESVEKLKVVLKEGTSILIFPEGTMNTTETPVKEFYDGAFRIAIETKTEIVPFVIINARKLLPRKNPLAIQPGFIKVYFSEPIQVENYSLEQLPELKARVIEVMENLIIKHQKK